MCNFFSGILKKDGTILYSKTSDNHHAIMDDHKLKDEDDTKKWLRFEIRQEENDKKNKDLKTWEIQIDSPTTPDWYLRNKSKYDEKMFEALKERLDKIISRFDIKTETKVLTALDKIFSVATPEFAISEDTAMKSKYVAAADPAHVVMVIAKTEEAKRVLSRFATSDVRIPMIKFSINQKDVDEAKGKRYIPIGAYSLDYLQQSLKVLDCTDDNVEITVTYNNPCRLENNHFLFLLAPRIKGKENDCDPWYATDLKEFKK